MGMVTLYLNVFTDWIVIKALMYFSVPFLILKHVK